VVGICGSDPIKSREKLAVVGLHFELATKPAGRWRLEFKSLVNERILVYDNLWL